MTAFKVHTQYSPAGDQPEAIEQLTASIVDGEVNADVPGFYVVEYNAINQFGWLSYVYRSVLVYEGDPYGEDISGTYKPNNKHCQNK